ncbi:Putative ribonuclease H protein At1g65750, partial [Linum grandiflorum]
GAIFGLRLAWELGFRKVNLQLDSQCVVDALLGDPPDDFRHSSCIREARNLLRRTWDVTVSHIFCEGNRVADALAHYGHSRPLGLHTLSCLSSDVISCLRADSFGVVLPRMISVNS